MNKKLLPLIVIILSAVLAISRLISTTSYTKEFWMFMVSSGLTILGMVFLLIGMRTTKNTDLEG